MAGNTGKMTAEAIEWRGPRMMLCSVYRLIANRVTFVGFVIARENEDRPIRDTYWSAKQWRRYATSYDIRYLLRIARSARSSIVPR